MTDDDILTVLERYSACRICTREQTKLCEDSVDYMIRCVYFASAYKNKEDSITKYCKHFNLSSSKLNKVLSEISKAEERERTIEERVSSCAQ